ncbi:MAG: hypothetical protein Fur0012_12420 [Elusimicrobiota bacterium]
MFSYYKRLKKDLDACAAEGLLGNEEAERIYKILLSRKRKMPDASVIITVLGGAFIAFGLGLIISYNWEKIGALTKITAFLSAYAGCGLAAIYFSEKKIISVPAEILWFFMPALGLGLYGQIFQLSSDPLKPFMVWALLSSFLVFIASRKYLNILLEILFYVILAYSLTERSMFSINSKNPVDIYFFISLLFSSAILLIIRASYIRIGEKTPPRLYTAILAYLFTFSASQLGENHSFILLGFAACAMALSGKDFPYRYFLLFSIAVYIFSFRDFYRPHSPADAKIIMDTKFFLAIVFSGLAYTLAVFRIITSGKPRLSYPMLAILAFSALKASGIFSSESDVFIFNALSIWLFIASILYGSEEKDKRFVNLGISITALIIISRFSDLFGKLGFLRTGFGFIISGAGLIVVAYYVNRWRKALIEKMEEI